MSLSRPRSLKWSLVLRIAVLQCVMLTLIIAGIIGAMLATGIIPNDYEDGTMDVLADALARDAKGTLVLKDTSDLAKLRSSVPDLWFIIRDKQGHRLQEGAVPTAYQPFVGLLDNISDARIDPSIGEASPPGGKVRWTDTAAGNVQIMCGTKGELSLLRVLGQAPNLFLAGILPLAGLMALATLFVTPWVVRGALSSLGRAATAAGQIDIDKRGVQLPLEGVPKEVMLLVTAVNAALARLDAGYERHKRFLTDAAHELRTPVAILNTRLASLPATPERARLLQDAARLSTLADQLLDLQRLDRQAEHFRPVDLVAVARNVMVDLAPMAFAAGYEMSFEPTKDKLAVRGDRTAIERAVTNLVQNAIDHGGNAGLITVSVRSPAVIEVLDEGGGVPAAERERIFEPFYRLRPQDHGAGLGLNLVRDLMLRHGGKVEVLDGKAGGACFRMIFPPAPRD
ncbi:HAMP domain-containing histidine kinase [Mesorhizobium sp. M1C.F.Ca.ET.193.01.1.1]|uniref:sensor histidine kinase n=1 Tax=unclassified Mesorhizobium TaxID=325217 RepID=UPI000FD1FB06|nr:MULTISPECIES: HAMP domain-containing sensor histidine kinase [unclassified Mesorhizobium]TGT04269.1 HAMP domain-containing histidine kinase [bacterium M00.F.Ca.ET.177.01.1.1]TGQ56859.1 HAMP domain-containing histidine kinase [Mesorhizobium sp. M1C.F.Ca.ET.210.01.1.1]TGQ75626.1 HAMP domain-containing histidine kinase [Mesorhizobium sp. M1C.F.Ca.ET.212.01.1.1]TGR14035.1 HAMP domain-containing histidine kinase [Mesorhizobium sp. M1C.F.Ca.ET.204.01.1.1]TGR34290.1 HAMP domain-containing histidin